MKFDKIINIAYCIVLCVLLALLLCVIDARNNTEKAQAATVEYKAIEIEMPYIEPLPTPTPTPEPTPTPAPTPTPELEQETMQLVATAYCGCAYCCGKSDCITATGTRATQGRTIAADPSVFPYGTKLLINGTVYIVEDCGGGITGNRIDIYFENHADAMAFGVQTVTAQIVE